MVTVAADSRWRLRDGSRLDRLADLPEDLRLRLTPEGAEAPSPDSGVLSRTGGRAAPALLDPDAAELLEQFGDGKSVAQAVLDLARARDLDPHELLEASLPAVRRLVGRGYLIDADAPLSALGYQVGDEFVGDAGTWRIVRTITRLEDSEVHLVRRVETEDGLREWGVLKLSTPERKAGRPEPEAEILRHVAEEARAESRESVTTALLDEGSMGAAAGGDTGAEAGPRWIILEFVAGTPIHLRARGARRHAPEQGRRARLAALCVAAARAFASLHRVGVAHGDVHPDNLLVTGSDDEPRVRLIDLGCARRLDDGRDLSSRPGIDLYREPEVASALREGRRCPAAAPAGEQYALAVVLFQGVTGHDYLDFWADRDELLRQVAEDEPRSFEELGVAPWRSMESVLRRALRKDPAARFDSMESFADALSDARSGTPAETVSQPETGPEQESATAETFRRAASRSLRRATLSGDGWGYEEKKPAWPSIFFGTSGLAWGLLHAAVRRGDADLLALADVWSLRALRDVADPETPSEMTSGLPQLETTPFHGAAGVHEVAACVAWARGDLRIFVRQARRFLTTSEESDDAFRSEEEERDLDVDLALGRPGSLVPAAHLLDRARPPHPDGSAGPGDEDGTARKDRFGLADLAADLRIYGDDLLDSLWRRLDRCPEIGRDDAWLGMAHGWAGALYATLVWCRTADRDLPEGLAARLSELAAMAIPFGRGLRWTRERAGRSASTVAASAAGRHSMAGWCHGSAGYVLLFDTASRQCELAEFRDVAQAAAWDVWDRFVASPKQASHLCCGLVGQAWSLLAHARETGDDAWIDRARSMAEAAVRRPVFDRPSEAMPDAFEGALFKGEGSLAALLADLERPEAATWPWLEDVEPGARTAKA